MTLVSACTGSARDPVPPPADRTYFDVIIDTSCDAATAQVEGDCAAEAPVNAVSYTLLRVDFTRGEGATCKVSVQGRSGPADSTIVVLTRDSRGVLAPSNDEPNLKCRLRVTVTFTEL